jgi:hypothetical protein
MLSPYGTIDGVTVAINDEGIDVDDDGSSDGDALDDEMGLIDGNNDGAVIGDNDTDTTLGNREGIFDGDIAGIDDGVMEGNEDDQTVGDDDGDCDGALVHALVDPKLRDVTDDKHPA